MTHILELRRDLGSLRRIALGFLPGTDGIRKRFAAPMLDKIAHDLIKMKARPDLKLKESAQRLRTTPALTDNRLRGKSCGHRREPLAHGPPLRAQYVWYGPREAALGEGRWQPDPGWPIAFRRGAVTLYALEQE